MTTPPGRDRQRQARRRVPELSRTLRQAVFDPDDRDILSVWSYIAQTTSLWESFLSFESGPANDVPPTSIIEYAIPVTWRMTRSLGGDYGTEPTDIHDLAHVRNAVDGIISRCSESNGRGRQDGSCTPTGATQPAETIDDPISIDDLAGLIHLAKKTIQNRLSKHRHHVARPTSCDHVHYSYREFRNWMGQINWHAALKRMPESYKTAKVELERRRR